MVLHADDDPVVVELLQNRGTNATCSLSMNHIAGPWDGKMWKGQHEVSLSRQQNGWCLAISMNMTDRKTIPNDMIMLHDFHHICLLVRDVEKTAETFAKTFGIGPFEATPYEAPASKAMVSGRPQGYKLKFANAKIGPITLELVEHVDGNSALTEFLQRRGEGLHHLAYCCPPPIDEELAKWKKAGIDALQVDKSISEDPRYGWAYMDTEKLVGCIVEIMCLPP